MAAVGGVGLAAHPAERGEAREQLRDGRAGDRGAARELGCGQRLAVDRAHHEVLRERDRGIVAGEQAVDPAARKRGDGDQRLGGVGGGCAGRRH